MPLGSAPLLPDRLDEFGATGETASALTAEIVGLLRQHTGRGPTKAKATLSPDVVLITVADCLTTAEKEIAAAGYGELVVRTRAVLHEAMRAEATRIVEGAMGRQVTAYLTAQHHDPDLAILVFYLGASRPRGA